MPKESKSDTDITFEQHQPEAKPDNDADAKIWDKLKNIDSVTDTEYQKFIPQWKKWERIYLGDQWGTTEAELKQYSIDYNTDGNPIYTIAITEDLTRKDIPKRTCNIIYPNIQTELAIINKMNPTPMVYSTKMEQRDRVHRLNVFLSAVYGRRTPKEFIKAIEEVGVLGQGFLAIKIREREGHKIPFFIRMEKNSVVRADPNAEEWEDVRWVIYTVRMYAYEIKKRYPEYEVSAANMYKVEELKEYFVKDENGFWAQYVTAKGKILKKIEGKDGYPVCLFQAFRSYRSQKNWMGISTVRLTMEEQIMINKRQSQFDWHMSMITDPPTEVDSSAIDPADVTRLPIKPGEFYRRKQGMGQIFTPVMYDRVNDQSFFNSIEDSKQSVRDTTAIQRSAMGQNETGVYTGKHALSLKESINTRMNLKEFWYKDSLELMCRKLLVLAKENLTGEKDYYEAWDADEMQIIQIPYSDFEGMENINVNVVTSDASMLEPTERLGKLIEMSQYMPVEPNLFYDTVENIYPGFFPDWFADQAQENIMATKEAKKLQLALQIAQMEMQQQQIQMQTKQMNQPQMEQPQGGMPPQPGPEMGAGQAPQLAPTVPEPQMGEAPPSGGSPSLEEVISNTSQYIAQSENIPVEEAQAKVVQAIEIIKQKFPGALDEVIIQEFIKAIVPQAQEVAQDVQG